MSPFLPRTHTFLDVGQSSNSTEPSAAPVPTAQRVVFILCIVFGSLLACVLAAIAIYLTRRHMHKRRLAKEQNLHRDASFFAGASSFRASGTPLTTPAQAKRARRPSARRTLTANPLLRLAIPSPELGSVFRLDSAIMRRGSGITVPPLPTDSPPTPEPASSPKAASARYQSLLSNGSTLVGPSSPPFDKYDMPLRVINPTPLTLLNTNTIQLQKPNPVYRANPSPSRERLVTSTASADSLASTPPLSPETTSHSQQGTFTITSSTTDITTPVASAVRKTLSQRSVSSLASSARRMEKFEASPYLAGLEHTPFVLPAVQEVSPALGRCRSTDEGLNGTAGTPVTLSHFPFRFSHTSTRSPSLPPAGPYPARNSHTGTQNPAAKTLNVSNAQRHGLGYLNNGSAWTLPHSMSSLKLKIKHAASDQIIAIAFVPHSVSFRAVCDAVRARLGFQPRRVWSDNTDVEIIDDKTLWSWLDEQYTKGYTRLILQVE